MFIPKKISELQFYDNVMFSEVMKDEEICKGVLELCLRRKISKIVYKQSESAFYNSMSSKSIRFDVYLEDSDTVYDIEMQCYLSRSIEKRVRYYQSSIDYDNLKKGASYKNLKDSYVIFICKSDPFRCGFPSYEVKSYLESERIKDGITESLKKEYKDGSHILFFNATAYKEERDDALRAFLEYVHSGEVSDNFTKKLEEKVEQLKLEDEHQAFYDKYKDWYYQDIIDDVKEESIKKGIFQGKEEGKKETILETAKKMKELGIEPDLIVNVSGLSKDEIEAL